MQQKFTTFSFDEINDEFEKNIHCFGIVSFMRSYRLCFYINKWIDDFKLTYKECEINFSEKDKSTEIALIQTYQFSDVSLGQEISLVCNKSSKGVLLPKSKQFDHFLLFKNMDDSQVNAMMKSLEILKDTIRFIPLDPAGIANFERLLVQ